MKWKKRTRFNEVFNELFITNESITYNNSSMFITNVEKKSDIHCYFHSSVDLFHVLLSTITCTNTKMASYFDIEIIIGWTRFDFSLNFSWVIQSKRNDEYKLLKESFWFHFINYSIDFAPKFIPNVEFYFPSKTQ